MHWSEREQVRQGFEMKFKTQPMPEPPPRPRFCEVCDEDELSHAECTNPDCSECGALVPCDHECDVGDERSDG